MAKAGLSAVSLRNLLEVLILPSIDLNMNLSSYYFLAPDMDYGDRQKWGEAGFQPHPADDQLLLPGVARLVKSMPQHL
jgi:hypothetical protein